jgi:hypothetical protein
MAMQDNIIPLFGKKQFIRGKIMNIGDLAAVDDDVSEGTEEQPLGVVFGPREYEPAVKKGNCPGIAAFTV